MRYKIISIALIAIALSGFGEEFAARHQKLSVGLSVSYFDYSEIFTDSLNKKLAYPDEPPKYEGELKSDEYGFSVYFFADYEVVFPNVPIFFKINGSIANSSFHTYDGSYRDTTLYDTVGVDEQYYYLERREVIKPTQYRWKDNSFFHSSFKIGYQIGQKKIKVTPYLGVRLNYWKRALLFSADSFNDTSDQYSVSEYDVREDYKWVQVTPGVKVSADVKKRLCLYAELSYDRMISGSMDFVNELEQTFTSEVVKLGNRSGIYTELGVVARVSPAVAVVASPYFQYYRLGLSSVGKQSVIDGGDLVTSKFVEPDSRTFNVGIKLAFQLQFSPVRGNN